MSDVELVIKVPEELYQSYKVRPPMLGDAGMDMIAQAIANGIPLPKGHGKIVDIKQVENVLEKAQVDMPVSHFEGLQTAKNYIKHDVPTIIKAESEE